MAPDLPLDLVCVGYLADTQILRVGAYPPANSGAVVEATAVSLAGDAPITAVIAARLGLRTGLICNGVGSDTASARLLSDLQEARVHHRIAVIPDGRTPHLTVIADDMTRTWFASLQRAYADLLTVDLTLLHRAQLAYIDCYRVLTQAAVRVITAVGPTPLLLNLGGDPADSTLIDAARDRDVAVVQTSLDEADADRAPDVAADLFARLRPDAAVVTLGRLGALAHTRTAIRRAAALPVVVAHTHGAGAAFSAGYAHALLAGADTDTALRAGCQAGAAHCAGPTSSPRHPTTANLATRREPAPI